MARRLIINADDFGLSQGVNAGIVAAYLRGVVTSTSLMVHRPGAQDAAALARRHPSLSVGLHVDDRDGANLDDPRQAARAFAAQLERFRELTGTDPTHVDSHHHAHASGDRLQIFSELVAPLAVPLRHDGQVTYLGGFWGQADGTAALEQVSRDALLAIVRAEVGEGFTEIGCHPARITGDFQSSYLDEREAELRTLTDPGLRREIETAGVELVSYREWRPRPTTD